MKVILKQDVENLGRRGDVVDVAPGYGRNYLVPKGLALEVTSSNIKMIEIEKQALQKKLERERSSYQEQIQKLSQMTLSFQRKSGEKDVIFGSVSSSDIKDALHELGFDIDKKKILLEEPIKRLGNYTVPVKIFHDDMAEIKVEVVKEGEEIKKEREEKISEKEKEELEEGKAEEEQEERRIEPEEERGETKPEEKNEEPKKVKTGEELEGPDKEERGMEEEEREEKVDAPEEKEEEREEKRDKEE